MPKQIQFLKRRNCHLCDEVLPLVKKVCAQQDLNFEVVDLDKVSGFEIFSDDIPVVLVDGQKVLQYPFNEAAVQTALNQE